MRTWVVDGMHVWWAVVAATILALPAVGRCAADSLGAREYVVVGSNVNIRTGPSTDRFVIGKTDKGDLFLKAGEVGDWFEIEMFSGERRYVSKAHAHKLAQTDPMPGHGLTALASEGRLRSLHASVISAMNRAEREATEVIPASADAERHVVLQKILEDALILEVMHLYGVQPALFGGLLEEASLREW